MSRPCLTCRHAEIAAINADLVSGSPRLTVARRYGLSEPAVRRHFHEHLPHYLIFDDEDSRREAASDLTELLRITTAEVRAQAERARALRRGRAFLRAVRVLHPLLELQARVLGRRL